MNISELRILRQPALMLITVAGLGYHLARMSLVGLLAQLALVAIVEWTLRGFEA